MNLDFKKLPKIGLRNVKTALSVMLCVLLFEIIHRDYPFYACIAAVICTSDSVESSFIAGKNRLTGSLIGGAYGILFMALSKHTPLPTLLLIFIGIIAVIYSGVLLKAYPSISISCVIFIAIMTNLKGGIDYIYAINRILDTFIGISIALLVNKYFNPKKNYF